MADQSILISTVLPASPMHFLDWKAGALPIFSLFLSVPIYFRIVLFDLVLWAGGGSMVDPVPSLRLAGLDPVCPILQYEETLCIYEDWNINGSDLGARKVISVSQTFIHSHTCWHSIYHYSVYVFKMCYPLKVPAVVGSIFNFLFQFISERNHETGLASFSSPCSLLTGNPS